MSSIKDWLRVLNRVWTSDSGTKPKDWYHFITYELAKLVYQDCSALLLHLTINTRFKMTKSSTHTGNDETSNVVSAKCPVANVRVNQLSFGQMSFDQMIFGHKSILSFCFRSSVHSVKCILVKCPFGHMSSAICPFGHLFFGRLSYHWEN